MQIVHSFGVRHLRNTKWNVQKFPNNVLTCYEKIIHLLNMFYILLSSTQYIIINRNKQRINAQCAVAHLTCILHAFVLRGLIEWICQTNMYKFEISRSKRQGDNKCRTTIFSFSWMFTVYCTVMKNNNG